MKRNKSATPFSYNTELWFADYFWPFFSNYSYEEIAMLVLDVLIESRAPHTSSEDIPQELLDSFKKCCEEKGLIDKNGCFVEPYTLVEFFCGTTPIAS